MADDEDHGTDGAGEPDDEAPIAGETATDVADETAPEPPDTTERPEQPEPDDHPSDLPPPPPPPPFVAAGPATLDDIREKLDTVAGAVAAVAAVATQQQEDIALALDVLTGMVEALDRLDARTEDRLAAVRDAAMAPAADLQALLAARGDRTDGRLGELSDAFQALAAKSASVDLDPLAERIDTLAEGVQALSWQVPQITEELTGLQSRLERVESVDVPAVVNDAAEALSDGLRGHTDTALAGALRIIDDRLGALRADLAAAEPAPSPGAGAGVGGFEAGAVMGAAQAAWNRLEQRLDNEFDDLGRQLEAMASLIDRAVTTTEEVANRPVVTGEQIRRTASSVKDAVMNASRSRRARRGGPRSLGSGSSGES